MLQCYDSVCPEAVPLMDEADNFTRGISFACEGRRLKPLESAFILTFVCIRF